METITEQHYNGQNYEGGAEYTCSKCWKICLHRGDNFCSNCGEKLFWRFIDKPVEVDTKPKCSSCNNWREKYFADYCGNCGRFLSD